MFSHLPSCIVYVRHPQCIHNLGFAAYDAALASGISNKNSPLTASGEIQKQLTAEYLSQTFGDFDATFASDFLRAQSIPLALGKTFIVDARVGERWHGQLHEQGSSFFEQFPDEKEAYTKDYYHYRAPGGESCLEVEIRLEAFLSDAQLFEGRQTILISGHGISGLCLRKLLMHASLEDWQRWHGSKEDRLKNASVTVYQRHDDYYDITLHNHVPWLGEVEVEETVEA